MRMLRPAFLTVVALAPLPFGAVPRWAWATLAALLAAMLVAWGGGVMTGRGSARRVPPAAAAAIAALVLVSAFAAVQSLHGLPGAHPLWAVVSRPLGQEVAGAISIDPAATRTALAKLLMLVAAFWLAMQCLARRADGKRLLRVVAVAAAIYGTYGLGLHALDAQTVLWVDKPAYREAATGPFINRNAFAAYLGLGLLAATAVVRERVRADGWTSLFGPAWGWAAIWLTVAAALAATQSRGGVAATAIGFVVFLLVSNPQRRRPAALGIAAAGLAALGMVPGDRWLRVPAAATDRLEVYDATLELIGQRPWLGHGFGSFEPAFRLVRPEDLDRVFVQAHNGYLEAAAGLGIPAACALIAGLAALAMPCWRSARAGNAAGAVGLGALTLVGAHALIDFAPQLPAVALTAASLVGSGAASARPGTDGCAAHHREAP